MQRAKRAANGSIRDCVRGRGGGHHTSGGLTPRTQREMLRHCRGSSRSVPRVLIADDDPVSLRFLSTAVGGLDCSVVAASNGTEALTAATWAAFDLLLIDRRMPDLSGAELLAALRARGITAPAIATSAELSPALNAQLAAAGFVATMEKPVALERLRQTVLAHLPPAADAAHRLLDDTAAAAAIGSDAEAMRALRLLFVTELADLEREWAADPAAIAPERLHRLRASCGFCGAPALGEAARALELALRERRADAQARAATFLDVCRATRAALSSRVGR